MSWSTCLYFYILYCITVPIKSIREVRRGKNTDVLKNPEITGIYKEECSFSIIYGDDFESIDLIALSSVEANIWVTGLNFLIGLIRCKYLIFFFIELQKLFFSNQFIVHVCVCVHYFFLQLNFTHWSLCLSFPIFVCFVFNHQYLCSIAQNTHTHIYRSKWNYVNNNNPWSFVIAKLFFSLFLKKKNFSTDVNVFIFQTAKIFVHSRMNFKNNHKWIHQPITQWRLYIPFIHHNRFQNDN